jgi:MtN3 and saliva related transmembrane protein
MNPDVIGWLASAVLLATLVRQIVATARDPDAKGVSRWLFAGQCVASIGFIAYSVMVGNLVFVATNAAILVTALVGQYTVSRRKSRAQGA